MKSGEIMREIKFRAWDLIKKEMAYNVGISPGGIAIRYGYQWFSPESASLSTDLMQYTGRKDKNGKRIFEGDIIQGNLIKYSPLPTMGEIVFDEHFFCYSNKNEAGLTGLYEIDQIEIIGNIYKNPELTKST